MPRSLPATDPTPDPPTRRNRTPHPRRPGATARLNPADPAQPHASPPPTRRNRTPHPRRPGATARLNGLSEPVFALAAELCDADGVVLSIRSEGLALTLADALDFGLRGFRSPAFESMTETTPTTTDRSREHRRPGG